MMRRLLCGVCAGLASQLWAAPDQQLALTANFLYRFAQYTYWPPPPRQHLHFCIDNHPALLELFAQTFVKQAITVSAFDGGAQQRCDVLMLTEFSQAEPTYWQGLTNHRPVLIVTDQAALYRHTGVIRLFVTPDGFNFDVNLSRARHQHGLQLSAQLLKLARTVN